LEDKCRIRNITVHCYLTVMTKGTWINNGLQVTFREMLLPQVNRHTCIFHLTLVHNPRNFYVAQKPLISISQSHTSSHLLTFNFLFLWLLVERYRPLFQGTVTVIVLLNQKRPWHYYTDSLTHKSQEGYTTSKTPLPQIPKLVHL
jgi:hypothetical protein